MIALYSLMAYSILLFTGCKRPQYNRIPDGIWKLERIEVLKDHELKKIIDTGYQYWKFLNNESIEIYNDSTVQKRMKIKAGSDSFSSIECGTGAVLDEYVIEKVNRRELELSSSKTIERSDYTVVYYLNKID